MKHLKAINKYFWKYRVRLGAGVLFVFLSNYFNVLTPQITGFVIEFVQRTLQLPGYRPKTIQPDYDPLVDKFIYKVEGAGYDSGKVVILCGIIICCWLCFAASFFS